VAEPRYSSEYADGVTDVLCRFLALVEQSSHRDKVALLRSWRGSSAGKLAR
jgi:hypothetical protein